MDQRVLLLGVDGGGTGCRARLCAPSGLKIGEGEGGPANIRTGLRSALVSVLEATRQCFHEAGLSARDLHRASACLALAGASEPSVLARAQQHDYPFGRTTITTDAHAACIGAHAGRDGGVIIAGTGSIGWAQIDGRHHRVGGWGPPISDEGSGAWLGCEALRRVLWAHDRRIEWTALLREIFQEFGSNPHAIVSWTANASPRHFGMLARRIVAHAERNDAAAIQLMRLAGVHIDALAERLIALEADRLALVGGLAPHVERWLSPETRDHLVTPVGDALDGAVSLARAAVESIAA
jgi:glucosamine kinase